MDESPESGEFDFEKLAREIVTSQLKDVPDPNAALGEIVRKIIVSAVQGTKVRQDPHTTVVAVCRGVLSGMLLLEKDLPATAVAVVQEMANISHEVPIDPQDLMTWSMEGIAAVTMMAGAGIATSVQEAIEHHFMGAGTVFSELCRKAAPKPAGG